MTWEDQAQNWTAWARTPGHDVFERYIATFFDEIVPAPRGRTLEVGCGEGRVVRQLRARGHDVTGIEASPTLARNARAADASAAYAMGDATHLPFADGRFATAVAYNMLQAMHAFEDMASAVGEAARVLQADGHLCVCVGHPVADVGLMTHRDGELVATGSYFARRRVDDAIEKNGLAMTFRGWTYTIEDYARAFEAAGLRIDRLREPVAATRDGGADSGGGQWQRMPLFLFLRGVKAGG